MNPEDGSVYSARRGQRENGIQSATNVEDAPSSAKLVGREWIKDIP